MTNEPSAHTQRSVNGRPTAFGPIWQGDGVCFQIWAPSVESLGLVLPERVGERELPMEPQGEGWFRLHVPDVPDGTPYGFRLPNGMTVPDPASRKQPQGPHNLSAVTNPNAYAWRHRRWKGRPWHEAVICEIHVGTFSPEGSFDGVRHRLGDLAAAGFTAIELMPVATFSGQRNWGYDGVLPFAPCAVYGDPNDLKCLVDEAHGMGLMVFLDVVYNHFGPDGNYIAQYAAPFFDPGRHTPWGAGIDFSQGPVRTFFIQNALSWLEEFRFDGLRFDAVHAIEDHSPEHFLTTLRNTIEARLGQDRHVHLILENGDNEAARLDPGGDGYTAQWNDDFHNALHSLLTGEEEGYYLDYKDTALGLLVRSMAQGFAYQGEHSTFLGRPRGTPSGGLPPSVFVNFLQNHDQIGNRPLGDRIVSMIAPEAVRAGLALVCLAPMTPMLFQGDEWGAPEPFLFFCDFHDDLADAVREGRRNEFSSFHGFRDAKARERIPDPNSPATFQASILDWTRREEAQFARQLEAIRGLLQTRQTQLVPLLAGGISAAVEARIVGSSVFTLSWILNDHRRYVVWANLADQPAPADKALDTSDGGGGSASWIFSTHPVPTGESPDLPAWFVGWKLEGSVYGAI